MRFRVQGRESVMWPDLNAAHAYTCTDSESLSLVGSSLSPYLICSSLFFSLSLALSRSQLSLVRGVHVNGFSRVEACGVYDQHLPIELRSRLFKNRDQGSSLTAWGGAGAREQGHRHDKTRSNGR